MSSLLQPITIGNQLPLRNRIVMASMTRNRCVDDNKPGLPQVQHYADRARDGTGLIVNEGTFVDWAGSDWTHAPFMITHDHAEAWRKVTDAVHKEGGMIFFQAWHAGRVQHDQMPLMKEKGGRVLAPSNIKAEGGKYRDLPGSPGHASNIEVIQDPREVVETYRQSIMLAKKAGFDGVELMAQGGYLPHQFLNSRSNKRTDSYGGCVENRCRFVLELVDVISQVFGGPQFISVKISPTDFSNDSVVGSDEMKETYTYLIKALVSRKVGIIHLSRRGVEFKAASGGWVGVPERPDDYPLPLGFDMLDEFGPLIKYPSSPSMLMVNDGYTVEEADSLIKENKIDLITFGRPFISNPDVVFRIKHGIPFAENDRGHAVYYGPYETPDENYNDWPYATV